MLRRLRQAQYLATRSSHETSPPGQIAVSTSCKGIILIADNAHYGKATESSPRTIGRAHARAARVTPVEALRL